MKIIYFGSGAFGGPTLRQLAKRHDVKLVVTQPDRAAGRHRKPTPTPIAEVSSRAGLDVLKPEDVNEPSVGDQIRAIEADAWVVIAYGQKLGQSLLADRFAVNLHASLLPKYRGAAPINWAIINGEKTTGLSVITLADRMDAGDVLGQIETNIEPTETAGELHDRLMNLGPELVEAVLTRFESGELTRQEQDASLVTFAPKLSKQDGTVRFDQPASAVAARIHGLTPWPGCRVVLGDDALRLHRALVVSTDATGLPPGTIFDDGCVACAPGVVRLLAVHPPGGKMMSFDAFARGRDVPHDAVLRPLEANGVS